MYLDASVFGGYFDQEFQPHGSTFFTALRETSAIALVSEALAAELAGAPEHVRNLLDEVIGGQCELLYVTEEVQELKDAYLSEKIVPFKWGDDALHVAHATVARSDVVVSWNFRHLVNPSRIRQFNAVNSARGYNSVVIMTPQDVYNVWKESDDG